MTPDDIKRDKAICNATPRYEIDGNGDIWDGPGFGAHRACAGEIHDELIREFIAAARERWPLYLAEVEETQRRIAAVGALADDYERAAERYRADGEHATADARQGKADVLRRAVRMLRGEK